MSEVSPVISNWRANESLHDYLARHNIPGISEIDTRALTRRGTHQRGAATPDAR